MSIRKISPDEDLKALEGRFVLCKNAQKGSFAVGEPFRVRSLTSSGARLMLEELPSVSFFPTEPGSDWVVYYPDSSLPVPQQLQRPESQTTLRFMMSNRRTALRRPDELQYVCDTADEAIGMRLAAQQLQRDLDALVTERLREFEQQALSGIFSAQECTKCA